MLDVVISGVRFTAPLPVDLPLVNDRNGQRPLFLITILILNSGTLNHDSYVYGDKYLGQAYFPVSVGAKK